MLNGLSDIERLLSRPPDTLPERVLVYGAGGAGRRITQRLQSLGVEVLALLDQKAIHGQRWLDLPVLHPNDAAVRFANVAVIIAVHNPGSDLSRLESDLNEIGFRYVRSLLQVAERYPALVDDFYWIAPPSIYGKNWTSIERVYKLLGDEQSRLLFLNVLAFRIGGDYRSAPLPESQQYFPASLPSWKQPMRLIDCGAYIGETVEDLRGGGYKIDAAICLEPDAKNYKKLIERIEGAICIPCAVAEKQVQLRFNAEAAVFSRLDANGECLVQAVSIDEAFFPFAPTLIKIDIEGGELGALEGAARTIEHYRPGLAVAAYHHAEHFWQLPLKISEYLPDAKFEFRSHAYNTFEVVLYSQSAESTERY